MLSICFPQRRASRSAANRRNCLRVKQLTQDLTKRSWNQRLKSLVFGVGSKQDTGSMYVSHRTMNLSLRPGRGAEYCDQPVWVSVCLSVCPRAYSSGTAGPIVTKFCTQIPCGRGSVLLRRLCATLCTSGSMDTSRLAVMGRMALRGRPDGL